jgi:hypothetical protein
MVNKKFCNKISKCDQSLNLSLVSSFWKSEIDGVYSWSSFADSVSVANTLKHKASDEEQSKMYF